jgi:hypothetical protein
MMYVVTMVVSADSLGEAWDAAYAAFPRCLAPDAIDQRLQYFEVKNTLGQDAVKWSV